MSDTDAKGEREAIVNYLRFRKLWTSAEGFTSPQDLAAEIERGDHMEATNDRT